MAVVNGTDLLVKVRQASTLGGVTDPGAANTGNGTVTNVTGRSAGISETWTLTNVVAGGAGVGVFSVSGSVSGIIGYAVVGTPFTSDHIGFTINAGGVAFIVGDNFQTIATVGTFVTVAALNSYRKNGDTDEQNFPTFGGTKYVVPGIRNVAYSVGGFLETSDVGQVTLRNHELVKAKVILQVLFDGTNGFQHEARPRSFTHEAGADGGLQPITFEFQGESATATQVGTGPIF
jgi:hypothetical protein